MNPPWPAWLSERPKRFDGLDALIIVLALVTAAIAVTGFRLDQSMALSGGLSPARAPGWLPWLGGLLAGAWWLIFLMIRRIDASAQRLHAVLALVALCVSPLLQPVMATWAKTGAPGWPADRVVYELWLLVALAGVGVVAWWLSRD